MPAGSALHGANLNLKKTQKQNNNQKTKDFIVDRLKYNFTFFQLCLCSVKRISFKCQVFKYNCWFGLSVGWVKKQVVGGRLVSDQWIGGQSI